MRLTAAGIVQTCEPFKNSKAIFGFDTRPVIHNRDLGFVVVRPETDRDVRRGVLKRVVTQVSQQALQVSRRARHSSGSEALRHAAYAVASGAYDMAMAVGVEKVKDSGYQGLNAFPIPPVASTIAAALNTTNAPVLR